MNPHIGADRLFRICFQTVESFTAMLVAAFWILLFSGSTWGDKFHYDYLFDVSFPIMIVVSVAGLLTWRCYRRHALLLFSLVLAWAVWAALPRL